MSDVHDQETRSYNMSQIKGKNTKPELLVRKFLHAQGLRFRIHVKNLPGSPDITLPRYKCVILIHGCFWHGHKGCKYFIIPKTRTEFWENKIKTTKSRDTLNTLKLSEQGWRVVEIWECQLKRGTISQTLEALVSEIKLPKEL
jgi:DNA mismatch endonuclease (patch repair protein)